MALKLRRDTAANWASNNPTLASGEPGVETDTGKLKIGDGVSAWNSLPAISGGAAGALVKAPTSSSQNTIQPSSPTVIPLTILGATGHTAPLLHVRNGDVRVEVNTNGVLPVVSVRKAAGVTASSRGNLQEWITTGDGNTIISSSGRIGIRTDNPWNHFHVGQTEFGTNGSFVTAGSATGASYFYNSLNGQITGLSSDQIAIAWAEMPSATFTDVDTATTVPVVDVDPNFAYVKVGTGYTGLMNGNFSIPLTKMIFRGYVRHPGSIIQFITGVGFYQVQKRTDYSYADCGAGIPTDVGNYKVYMPGMRVDNGNGSDGSHIEMHQGSLIGFHNYAPKGAGYNAESAIGMGYRFTNGGIPNDDILSLKSGYYFDNPTLAIKDNAYDGTVRPNVAINPTVFTTGPVSLEETSFTQAQVLFDGQNDKVLFRYGGASGLSIAGNTISAIGSATNVSVKIVPQGTGVLHVSGAALMESTVEVKGQYFSNHYTAPSAAINWNNANVQSFQLTSGAQAITLSNPKEGGRYLLALKQPVSGAAGTVTWPTIKWQGGTPPTLTVTNSKTDLVSLIYIAGSYYGTTGLNY